MQNRIRELRKAKGLTMKQLGAFLGVAESTISQYETGKRQPDNKTLLRLGKFFDVTVGYILCAETEKAPTENGERITDNLVYAINKITPALSEKSKKQLIAFAQFLAEDDKKEAEAGRDSLTGG